MKRMILLAMIPVLASCATPRENCLKAATKDLAVVDRLIAETQTNLQRGYALDREPYTASRVDLCVGSGRYRYGGAGIAWNYCARPETRYRSKPVAIDPAVENRKLQDLKRTRARLVEESNSGVAQCSAKYPAG